MTITSIFKIIIQILISLFFIRHGIRLIIRNSQGYKQMLLLLKKIDIEIKALLIETMDYINNYCPNSSIEEAFDNEDKEIIYILNNINKSSLFTKLFFIHPSFYVLTRLQHIGKSNIQILNKTFVQKINRIHFLLEKQRNKHRLITC